ncbi:MAG: hypothetical protein GY874_23415 [Desulfobacteraceae bacterium]|nr:hypothetical protein [Desulfobacteraceae bacterium]
MQNTAGGERWGAGLYRCAWVRTFIAAVSGFKGLSLPSPHGLSMARGLPEHGCGACHRPTVVQAA